MTGLRVFSPDITKPGSPGVSSHYHESDCQSCGDGIDEEKLVRRETHRTGHKNEICPESRDMSSKQDEQGAESFELIFDGAEFLGRQNPLELPVAHKLPSVFPSDGEDYEVAGEGTGVRCEKCRHRMYCSLGDQDTAEEEGRVLGNRQADGAEDKEKKDSCIRELLDD